MALVIKKFFPKDPDARLDYVFNWTKWLEAGETIETFELVEMVAVDVDESYISVEGKKVIIWVVKDEDATVDEAHVTCRIHTSGGRKDDRTMGFNLGDN